MSDHAFHTLLRAIQHTMPGAEVCIDDVRPEMAAAQLTGFEKGQAFKDACRSGYLRDTDRSKATTWPPAKGRRIQRYKRTRKPIPAHVCQVA